MSEDQDYFSVLPDEMVMQILFQLDFDGMLAARICCARFDILLSEIFVERSIFNLARLKQFRLESDNPEHNWVFKTNKKFKNVRFNEFNFDEAKNSDIEEFLNLHGEFVVQLHLIYCTVNEVLLHKILDKTVNLKYLKLGLSRDINGANIINKLYDRCVEITFATTTTMDKYEVGRISADRKSTIEELNLEFVKCRRSWDDNAVFRESGVYKVLVLVQPSLLRFELFATSGDENILHQLSELNLNLETFKIYLLDQIEDNCVLTLSNQMKNLQRLEVNGTLFSNDNANILYDNLPELRSLSFRECDVLCDIGIINVKKLKKLEEFEANTCQNLSNRGIVNGIASCKNTVLKRLTLYQHYSDDTIVAIVNNLPELTTLEISTCLFFSPHLIPLIYERLPKLKSFAVSSLNTPADADKFENPDEVTKFLPEPTLNNPDIEVDALQNLTSLRMYCSLQLPGCTMPAIMKLKYLRDVTLHHYETVTKFDIIELLQSCRSLRKIDFRFCNDLVLSAEDRLEIRRLRPRIKFSYNMQNY